MHQTGLGQGQTAAQWAQVKEVLFEVFAAPKDQQLAAAEKLCGGDTALWAEVNALLQLEEDHPIAIDRPAVPAINVGSKIGRFYIEKKLGSGGMGTVYLARGQEIGAKQVAIKTLHTPNAGDAVTGRFYREREILANLQHPNIAKLYEGGTDQNGTPFLVMEYIEGEPVTTYCDQHRLSLESRMRLFIKVCEAVDDAHQNLVVHRDIKPGNILVDRSGTPKLLDFGIAKLLDPLNTGTHPHPNTATHLRPMTPSYAAPEQVLGEPITTLTDVYALGLLLYELLFGCRAQRLETGERAELIEVIVRNDPPTFLQLRQPQSDIDWEDIAGKRSTHPQKMQGVLHPELQAIISKALQKNPEARYPSARKLAQDVARPLKGTPPEVMAGHPFYFLWRTILANSGKLVLAMGLFGLALVAMLAVWSAGTETRLEERRAQELAAFTVNMLTMATPQEAALINDVNLPASPLLDLAEQHLDELKNQDPQRRAQLLHALGRVQQNRGFEKKAGRLLEQALNLQQQVPVPNPQAEIEIRLTLLRHCFSLGLIEEGFEHIQRNRALLESVPEDEWQCHAKTLTRDLEFRLEAIFFWLGDEQAMLDVHQKLETLFEQPGRTSGPEYVEFLRSNIHFRMFFSILPISIQEAGKAIGKSIAIYGSDHVNTALIRIKKAVLLNDIGRYQQALTEFDLALPILEKNLGAFHPQMSFPYFFKAISLINLGDIEKAETLLDNAQLIFERTDMSRQWHKLSSLYMLIYTLRVNGMDDRAEPLILKGLETFGDNPKYRAMASGFHLQYAGILLQRGDTEAAGSHYRKALNYRRETLGEDHYLTGYAYQTLGVWYGSKGDQKKAHELISKSLSMGQSQGLRGTYMRLEGTRALMDMAQEQKDLDRAIALCGSMLPEIEQALGPGSYQAFDLRIRKCELLLEQNDKKAATRTFQEIQSLMNRETQLKPDLKARVQALEPKLANPTNR